MPRRRSAIAAGAAAVLCVSAPAPAAATATATTGEGCSLAAICLWSEPEFAGVFWSWPETGGYANVPAYLHHHVGSFVSAGTFCLLDQDPPAGFAVGPGSVSADFLDDEGFGSRVEGVQGGAC